MVIWQNMITRDDLTINQGARYLFGDNVKRTGVGGQAAVMRGEPNAWGIATKWAPSARVKDYFSDDQYDDIAGILKVDFAEPLDWVTRGGILIVPARGLGTGLAKLAASAPRVNQLMRQHVRGLVAAGAAHGVPSSVPVIAITR